VRSGNGCAGAPPNCFRAVKPSRLAVDTNILLDLADEVDGVLDAASVIDNRLPQADKLMTPSVLVELARWMPPKDLPVRDGKLRFLA
jgi:hypothetical protein